MSTPSNDTGVQAQATAEAVDGINASFYSKYPYPWRALTLSRALDDSPRQMLCQALGDWDHSRVPKHPSIWVAGCGTNQALMTALRFPNARVIGSDLSSSSLDICRTGADELSVGNLELRRESIGAAEYNCEFDYVICTGVIHHNAHPEAALARLSQALKPSGVLELMVYNTFHRVLTSAFQRALRLIMSASAVTAWDERGCAERIVRHLRTDCRMKEFVGDYRDAPAAKFADALMQPVEKTYCVESLAQMAQSCELELLGPCANAFDKALGTSWKVSFTDSELQERFDALDDAVRWQVSNLLLTDRAPMLWFYLQPSGGGRRRKTERQICEEFLATRLTRVTPRFDRYVLKGVNYRAASGAGVSLPIDPQLREVVIGADGLAPTELLLRRCGLSGSFQEINEVRMRLTTPEFPYLTAVASQDTNEAHN